MTTSRFGVFQVGLLPPSLATSSRLPGSVWFTINKCLTWTRHSQVPVKTEKYSCDFQVGPDKARGSPGGGPWLHDVKPLSTVRLCIVQMGNKFTRKRKSLWTTFEGLWVKNNGNMVVRCSRLTLKPQDSPVLINASIPSCRLHPWASTTW